MKPSSIGQVRRETRAGEHWSATSTAGKLASSAPSWVLVLAFAAAMVGGCARPSAREKCERVAQRLMPNPSASFIDQCTARARDPETAKTIDCLLAVGPQGVFEQDLERCGAKQHLPLYFQF